MEKIKRVLFISVFINIVLLAHTGKKIYSRLSSVETNRPSHYAMRIDYFKSLPNPKNKIVMVGDSLIERGYWNELVDNSKVINRGISGITIRGLLKSRLVESLDQSNEIILLIGINDIWQNRDELDIQTDLKTLFTLLNKKNFKKVSIIGLLPAFDKELAERDLMRKRVNKLIGQSRFHYIDLEETLNHSKFFMDGVHLNGHGYKTLVSKVFK